ncbi:hypothetical protein SLS62_007730 [Diatrype stigma]|uniref:FAM192A/Fyv6 N-terminal domain-containing protein n=1 Tax=Diatrype stigma TaxID=117547 RepID=A0AAN9UND6_9PEZI
MSSRFVSGGTIAGDSSFSGAAPPQPALAAATSSSISPPPSSSTKPHAHTTANPSAPALHSLATAIPTTTSQTTTTTTTTTRSNNAEWEAAQAALAAERKQREESRRRAVEGGDGAGGGGGENQSLYEILQANKAAKQAAFEDANRIRNQFRALDDDEVDFLDGVEAQRRAEEERLRSETEARLEAFRRAQRGGGGSGGGGDGGDGGEEEQKGEVEKKKMGVGNEAAGVGAEEVVEEWSAVGRKRKRDRERERLVKGVKKRATEGTTTTTTREKEAEDAARPTGNDKAEAAAAANNNRSNAKPVGAKNDSSGICPQGKTETAQPTNGGPAKPNLGLVDYGSDDEDED